MSSPSDDPPAPPPPSKTSAAASSSSASSSSSLYHSLGRHGASYQSPHSQADGGSTAALSSASAFRFGRGAIDNGGDDDDDDVPLGAGLGGPLPRRNHTISSGTTRAKAKKLPQHFEQPVSPGQVLDGPSQANSAPMSAFRRHNPASPSRNSLREIAGLEDEHDEWEKDIQDEHHHSAVELLANLPESSSTSSIRRHQSLNHHIGRSMASRLSGRAKEVHTIGPSSPAPSITSQLQSAFDTNSPSNSARHSPTKSFSNGPWSDERDPAASPSRFARHFASNNSLNNAFAGSSSPPVARGASPNDQMQGNLMDVHAALQKLDLGGPISEDATSTSTASPSFNKKLPSLITNPDVLAASSTSPHHRSDSIEGGPISAAPILGQSRSRQSALSGGRALGHSRVQSTDGVLYSNRPGFQGPDGGHIGLVSPPPPSLAGIFGPHTAAPLSHWAAKERLAGVRGGSTPAEQQRLQQQQQYYQQQQQQQHNQAQQQAQWGSGGQHQRSETVPSQWGMGLSPVTERDQVTMALSQALAEQQQRTAVLEAALRARGGIMTSPPPPQQQQTQSPYTQSYSNTPLPPPPTQQQQVNPQWQSSSPAPSATAAPPSSQQAPPAPPSLEHLVGIAHPLNPMHFELSPPSTARFLVIKSFTEEDVHRSIRHGIWASTDKGNQRLNRVYSDCQRDADQRGEPATVYLFFSINGSGHFCGLARMTSAVDFDAHSDVWAQEGKWKGTFKVEHIFVKDVPNRELRHIKLPNSPERKNVTQSRDTQELDREGGVELLRIVHGFPARTSLLGAMGVAGAAAHRQGQQGLGLAPHGASATSMGPPPPPPPGYAASAAPTYRLPSERTDGSEGRSLPPVPPPPSLPLHLGFPNAPSPHLAPPHLHLHQQRLATPPLSGGSPMLPPIHLGFGGQHTPTDTPTPAHQQQGHGGRLAGSRSPMMG